jgi:hypothetical protein
LWRKYLNSKDEIMIPAEGEENGERDEEREGGTFCILICSFSIHGEEVSMSTMSLKRTYMRVEEWGREGKSRHLDARYPGLPSNGSKCAAIVRIVA